jgi:hypothetical protein
LSCELDSTSPRGGRRRDDVARITRVRLAVVRMAYWMFVRTSKGLARAVSVASLEGLAIATTRVCARPR